MLNNNFTIKRRRSSRSRLHRPPRPRRLFFFCQRSSFFSVNQQEDNDFRTSKKEAFAAPQNLAKSEGQGFGLSNRSR
ncbi:hypothetical protein SDJN02_19062, partial [Cucurbita argyrosperma subsp. argyrosperma]